MRIFFGFLISLFLLSLGGSHGWAQGTCNLPTITTTSGGGIYCQGDQVTLSLTGELGDATAWEWYVGSCGQNVIQTSTSTSVEITVSASISYFVRGVGGCVPGNNSCQEFEIVLDDEPPTPVCSDDVMVTVASGETEAIVEYDIPGATDNCPGGIKIELIEGIKSGGSFPLGTTEVSYLFTDARGNSSICSFQVELTEGTDPTDPTGPMITCPEDITAVADAGQCQRHRRRAATAGRGSCRPDCGPPPRCGRGPGASGGC